MKKLKRSLNEAVDVFNSSKDSDQDVPAEKEETKRIKGRKQHRLWKQQKLEKKLSKQQQKLEKESELVNETSSIKDKSFKHTVSIAIPGSIMCNAQTPMLKTYLAGEIARAAAIYQVDEIVIFDDMGITRSSKKDDDLSEEEKLDLSEIKGPCIQMGIILQYLECPQYLRKDLFKMQVHLEHAGVLNPLDTPHHFRKNDESSYREGIVTKQKAKSGQSLVNVGLQKEVHIDKEIQSNVRVTVKLDEASTSEKKLKGVVVAPNCPRNETGIYWGYNVRLAHSLGSILTECPYEGGYDLTIGTSDKGVSIYDYEIPNFKHMLIVFGGLAGLEASLEADEGLKVEDPKHLFSAYLNTCPNQGTKVIRTEEALIITLTLLKFKMKE